jgi:hypothetical protein
MTPVETLDVIKQIVWALGGSSVVIAGLSYFLGQVWAGRILDRERAVREGELERLRAELTAMLRQLEHELALQREKNLSVHQLKLSLYQAALVPIVSLVSDITFGKVTADDIPRFDRERLIVYSNLAMFAPSDVLDAHTALLDYVFDCLEGKAKHEWATVRTLGLEIFNKIRVDVGLATDPVTYKGHR